MKEIVNKISSLKSANVACLFLVVSLCGCTDPSKIAKEQNTVQGNNEGGGGRPSKAGDACSGTEGSREE